MAVQVCGEYFSELNFQQLLVGLGNVAQWSKAGKFSLQTTIHCSPHKTVIVALFILGFMSKIGTSLNIIHQYYMVCRTKKSVPQNLKCKCFLAALLQQLTEKYMGSYTLRQLSIRTILSDVDAGRRFLPNPRQTSTCSREDVRKHKVSSQKETWQMGLQRHKSDFISRQDAC